MNLDKEKELETFFEQKIKSITPLLREYDQRIKNRKINCALSIHKLGFSVRMYFKDGCYHELTFDCEKDPKYLFFSFKRIFNSEDGNNCFSTDGVSITSRNWSKKLVSEKIEKEIEDFLFYADRHGGY